MLDPVEEMKTSPMNRRQWLAVLLCVVVFAIDGFDILAISFAAPGLSEEWSLRQGQLGVVLSLELFGMAFGSMLLGRLADSAGRRKVMIGALSVLGVSMSLCAAARNVAEFGVLRLVTGIAIGAVIPALTAMVSETANEKNRDLAVSWMGAGFPIGAIVSGLLSSLVLEHHSWRGIFMMGGIATAAVLLLVIFLLPETVAYLERRRPGDALGKINAVMRHFGKSTIAGLPPARDTAPAKRGMTILPGHVVLTALPLLAIYSLHLWTYYFILKWLPKILTDLGVSPSVSASSLVLASIGGVLGSTLFGVATAHFPLRRLIIMVMILSTAAVVAFGFSTGNLNVLMLIAMIASCFTTAGAVGLYSLVARSYSAEWRSTGTGLVLGAGRGIAALGPIFTGYLFQSGLTLPAVAMIVGSGSLIGALMIYMFIFDQTTQNKNASLL